MNVKVTEVLQRTVEAESVDEVQEMYDNEDIVLDYSDLVSTDIVPELPVTIVVTNAATGDVVMFHVEKELENVEQWLEENYTRFNSDCMWMVTDKEAENRYVY